MLQCGKGFYPFHGPRTLSPCAKSCVDERKKRKAESEGEKEDEKKDVWNGGTGKGEEGRRVEKEEEGKKMDENRAAGGRREAGTSGKGVGGGA
eukprot:2455895-Rhodomonas_salina.1